MLEKLRIIIKYVLLSIVTFICSCLCACVCSPPRSRLTHGFHSSVTLNIRMDIDNYSDTDDTDLKSDHGVPEPMQIRMGVLTLFNQK